MGRNGLNRNSKKRERLVRIKRGLRLFYLRILRLRGKPEELAGGMAIGVAIGFTPTVPFHLVLAVILAFLLGKSKLSAALGSQVANPFFLAFIYLLDYKVGQFIIGSRGPSLIFSDFSASELLALGWDIYYPLLVGGVVVGALSILPSYFLTKKVVILYRERRRRRWEKIGFPSKTA